MAEIRADLSQYYVMKSLFERVLGRSSFRRLKDYAPLAVWKVEARKLIKAIALSIESTVPVVDDEWKDEVKSLLDHGVSRVEMSASVDQLFASLAATFGELAFLQVGFVPRGHWRVDRIPLIAGNSILCAPFNMFNLRLSARHKRACESAVPKMAKPNLSLNRTPRRRRSRAVRSAPVSLVR